MKTKKGIIKMWAVVFQKSEDIYQTLSEGYPLGQMAIFRDVNGASSWRKKNAKQEMLEPKIVPVEIKILKVVLK